MSKVLIVGGVAGGATAAARLRRLDEHAEIILFEKDEHISFANCGLPYHIGGVIEERDDLLLQTPESFHSRFNVDVRNYSEVTEIDRENKTVTVRHGLTGDSYSENYDTLILAPGSSPIAPPIPGVDLDGVFTLRNVANMDSIMSYIHGKAPKNAVVVGGGYIGVEMAENLRHAGLYVSVVELSEQVIAPLDFDMACEVHKYLRTNGISLYLNNGVKSIAQSGNALTVMLNKGEITADLVIMAVGVRPDSGLAKNAGLALGKRGGIIVDKHMQTSDKSIYAVGDAVEVIDFVTKQEAMIPLAGPANKQARIAADHICGIASEYGGTQGSAILKVFEMTVATTGVNEKTTQRLGMDYDKVYAALAGHASYYPGSRPMSIKVLFERGSGKILGGQIVGFDGVDKRCDLLAAAIRFGATAHELTQLELCYAPPFGSAKDPVNMAGYMIGNVLEGNVKQFHWHDVDALPRDGSVTLLDVRTIAEHRTGAIDGFLHIPVDELRERISELPKGKTVYVHCHSGLRSYIACRILTQNGFDAYNLAGGWRLYKSVSDEQALK